MLRFHPSRFVWIWVPLVIHSWLPPPPQIKWCLENGMRDIVSCRAYVVRGLYFIHCYYIHHMLVIGCCRFFPDSATFYELATPRLLAFLDTTEPLAFASYNASGRTFLQGRPEVWSGEGTKHTLLVIKTIYNFCIAKFVFPSVCLMNCCAFCTCLFFVHQAWRLASSGDRMRSNLLMLHVDAYFYNVTQQVFAMLPNFKLCLCDNICIYWLLAYTSFPFSVPIASWSQ